MDWKKIENYINDKSEKIVEKLDLENEIIKYKGITQGRNIEIISGDEEMSRAFIITKLVNELGYSADKIEIEHEYTAGRPHTNTSRIDVIVRDENDDAFLFIEVKSPDEYASIDKDATIEEQLYKVAFMENAEGHNVKYLVLCTTTEVEDNVEDECIIIDMERYSTFSDWESERNCTNELPSHYGRAQHKPYIKDSEKDLETNFSGEMLNKLQSKLHNVLWGGGGTDDNEIFAALTNIILAKIHDEDTTESGEVYHFQSLTYEDQGEEEFESNETLFERINGLYREALKSKMYITDESVINKSYVVDTNKFSLSKLKFAVQELEGLSFVDGKNSLNGKDILGDFFEGIIRDGFKQNKGQFFTHINIVKFMLWATQADKLAIDKIKNEKELPYMIDPSAGSGTFLIEYMKFITENMKYRFRDKLGTTRAVKDKIESDWFYPSNRENKWAQTYIYASEVNFNLGTATKVNMILHGDGSTNVFVKDGLLPFDKYEKETEPNVMRNKKEDEYYSKKDVNDKFDIILTNPPFSVDLDNDTQKTLKKSFVFWDKSYSENLFIERWYQLLKENGRLAAVLPESVFDIAENKYIRLFLFKYFKIKGVVSLPQLTFEPYTSTKTSILFAQKKTQDEIKEWDNVWNKYSNEYSKLKTRVVNIIDVYDGKKNKNRLPSIKKLSEKEEKAIIMEMLYAFIGEEDKELSKGDLIEKFRTELEEMCEIDTSTKNVFGFVNTFWVFGKVSEEIDYDIFMAEAESIGYKRTKRTVKKTKNELYDLEYAPDKIESQAIIDEYQEKIDELSAFIKREKEDLKKNKKGKKQIEARINVAESKRNQYEKSLEIIGKYYKDGVLKSEYSERTDDKLINEFKNGLLSKYCSNRVALHTTNCSSILDHMRKISWD